MVDREPTQGLEIEQVVKFLEQLASGADRAIAAAARRLISEIQSSDRDRISKRLSQLEEWQNDVGKRFSRLEDWRNEVAAELVTQQHKYYRLGIETNVLAKQVREQMVFSSLGIPLQDGQITRVIPVRIYLTTDIRYTQTSVEGKVSSLLRKIGFNYVEEYPEENGSWWKKYLFESDSPLRNPEFLDRLAKVEKAIEIVAIDKPQSEVDQSLTQSAVDIIKSLVDVPDATIQIGNILVVKTTHRNRPKIQVRTLSARQLLMLESDEKLLKAPKTTLKELGFQQVLEPEREGTDEEAS